MADACEKAMKDEDIMPHHIEGHRGGTWILQDYGDVILHLFSEEAREFYSLDRLWADANEIDLGGYLRKE
jgi:ribosome-associated protein